MNDADPSRFWDDLYTDRAPATDPRPNARLVEIATGWAPGTALDLGCGPGGDTLWLARRGWRVTATDISAVAVGRVAGLTQGLPVTAVRHDLGKSFPEGRFDLVSAHYFHTPFELSRAEVFRTAALALNPGGRLLIVDHGSAAPWSWNQDARFPAPPEVAAGIALDPAVWTLERADAPRRIADGPDGQSAEVTDTIVIFRRAA